MYLYLKRSKVFVFVFKYISMYLTPCLPANHPRSANRPQRVAGRRGEEGNGETTHTARLSRVGCPEPGGYQPTRQCQSAVSTRTIYMRGGAEGEGGSGCCRLPVMRSTGPVICIIK